MAQSEAILFWITVALYLASSITFLASLIFRKVNWPNYAIYITLLGFLCHNATIITRWIATGHAPIIGDYENTLAGSWLIILLFLVVQLRFQNLRPLGVAIVPFALLMLGYGVMRSPQLEPITPPFQSNWLYVHVTFAWFAYSSYVIATGFAILFLLRERRRENQTSNGFYGRLPSSEILDELGYRFITFGFVADAVMLVAGSIWANSLWGSYWAWDPIETSSLVSWLIYGLYLHLRVVHGWRLKQAAWLAIIALPAVIVSFFGINYLATGLHVF
ncbi:c-type cytochrome biogenesis protein CcsB [Chloroflexota bacterium]